MKARVKEKPVIRRFKKEDAEEVSRLVSDSFNEFVAPDFTKKELRSS
jgi:hypothetical protein